MVKVNFIFDKEKDLKNIYSSVNSNKYSNNCINQKIVKIAKDKNFQECKNEIEKYYEKVHKSKLIPYVIKSANNSWNLIEDEFFKRLEKLMGKKIVFEKVNGYFTSVERCPYNPDLKNSFFYFCGFNGIFNILKTAAHEIMHIQFHNTYWEEIEKKIGERKTWDLKEALTVLLNLEFKDLWLVEDKGYENHKKLRVFISKTWNEDKNFEKLLDACVDYLRKN